MLQGFVSGFVTSAGGVLHHADAMHREVRRV